MKRLSKQAQLIKAEAASSAATVDQLHELLERADETIMQLKRALDEATEWNWLDEIQPVPDDVVRECKLAWMMYNDLLKVRER